MGLPKIITISGVDGSGKTTVATYLKKDLEKKGYKVFIRYSTALLKTPSEPKNTMSSVTAFLVFLKDYLKIIIQYGKSFGRYDYIIFDRFLYDTIVKISYKQNINYIQLLYVFLTKILFPLPHLSFLLKASASVTLDRDKEHTQTYHKQKLYLYKILPSLFTIIVIDSNKPLLTVLTQIKRSF